MKRPQVSRNFLVCIFSCWWLSFLAASPAWGQTNFVKGYYVTASKDTISGYIEFGSDAKNSKRCLFKANLKSKAQALYPEHIEGYVLMNKEFFEKHSFQQEGKSLVGFFKVLIRGQLSLLKMNSRYFVKDRQGRLFDITHRGATKLVPYGVSVLKDLMQDCLDVYYNLNDDFRSNEDLPRIFRKYNRCSENSITAFEPAGLKLKSTCTAGVSLSALTSSVAYDGIWSAANFRPQTSFSGGGYVSVFIPRIHENFRVILEILYNRTSRYAFFQYDQTNNDLLLDHTYVLIPIYAQVPVGKLLFLVGPQGLLVKNGKDRWRQELLTQDVIITKEMVVQKESGLSPGIMVGLGTTWNVNTIHITPSARFSISKSSTSTFKPSWEFLEFNLKVGFNRRS